MSVLAAYCRASALNALATRAPRLSGVSRTVSVGTWYG